MKNLDKSMAFFKAVGFSFNPQFTDKTAACLVADSDLGPDWGAWHPHIMVYTALKKEETYPFARYS